MEYAASHFWDTKTRPGNTQKTTSQKNSRGRRIQICFSEQYRRNLASMETEKKNREETKKCLKPLLQNWRTDDCTDENRSEKYILFCFPRIVVPKQAQHSLCVHLRRLVI